MDFTVIIPHKNSFSFLLTLLKTIPDSNSIEVIIVDNSTDYSVIQEFKHSIFNSNVKVFFSDPDRYAGGARNIGLSKATGKWIIFADADDYFTSNAFEIFYSHIDSISDIVYYSVDGIYSDTLTHSSRGDKYTNLVKEYVSGNMNDSSLRYQWPVPWGKMIKKDFIIKNKLQFDEILAGNDIYFSLTSGFYASSIEAYDSIVYIVTVNKGSLTQRRTFNNTKSRLLSKLHCNQFLKLHGLSNLQFSVMFALSDGLQYGVARCFELLKLIISYHQNPFIGAGRWLNTMKNKKIIEEKDSRFIVHNED